MLSLAREACRLSRLLAGRWQEAEDDAREEGRLRLSHPLLLGGQRDDQRIFVVTSSHALLRFFAAGRFKFIANRVVEVKARDCEVRTSKNASRVWPRFGAPNFSRPLSSLSQRTFFCSSNAHRLSSRYASTSTVGTGSCCSSCQGSLPHNSQQGFPRRCSTQARSDVGARRSTTAHQQQQRPTPT